MTLINSDIDFPKVKPSQELSIQDQEAMDAEEYSLFLAYGDTYQQDLMYNQPSMDPINHETMPLYTL